MMKNELMVVAAGLAAACGGVESLEGAEAGLTAISLTEVHLRGEAPPVVRVLELTPDEAARLHGRLEAERGGHVVGTAGRGLAADLACGSSSLWLYDQGAASLASANRICFTGLGVADLGAFSRTQTVCGFSACWTVNLPWARAVRGVWPGSEHGRFVGDQGRCGHFAAWGGFRSMPADCERATHVELTTAITASMGSLGGS